LCLLCKISDCNGDDKLAKCAASTKCYRKEFICDSDFECGESDPSDEDPELCDGSYFVFFTWHY